MGGLKFRSYCDPPDCPGAKKGLGASLGNTSRPSKGGRDIQKATHNKFDNGGSVPKSTAPYRVGVSGPQSLVSLGLAGGQR